MRSDPWTLRGRRGPVGRFAMILRIDHRGQETRRPTVARRAEPVQRSGEPAGLRLGEPQGKAFAVRRRVELPPAPIERSRTRLDEVLVDQLPQDPD